MKDLLKKYFKTKAGVWAWLAAGLVMLTVFQFTSCGARKDTEPAPAATTAAQTTAAEPEETSETTAAVTETVTETETETETVTEAKTETDTETVSEEPQTETEETQGYTEYRFRNKKLLNQHYEKHGKEMGFASAKDYEAAASDVINSPEALYKLEAEDGDGVYYIEETNEFVILSTDGYIRTYFLPNGGKKYFDRQ